MIIFLIEPQQGTSKLLTPENTSRNSSIRTLQRALLGPFIEPYFGAL